MRSSRIDSMGLGLVSEKHANKLTQTMRKNSYSLDAQYLHNRNSNTEILSWLSFSLVCQWQSVNLERVVEPNGKCWANNLSIYRMAKLTRFYAQHVPWSELPWSSLNFAFWFRPRKIPHDKHYKSFLFLFSFCLSFSNHNRTNLINSRFPNFFVFLFEINSRWESKTGILSLKGER